MVKDIPIMKYHTFIIREIPNICWECTGSGLMLGFYPCKICSATGILHENNNFEYWSDEYKHGGKAHSIKQCIAYIDEYINL